jgi:ketosteroid isomerase-like protein
VAPNPLPDARMQPKGRLGVEPRASRHMHRVLLGCVLAATLPGCQRPSATEPGAVRRIIEAHNADAERWYAAGRVDSLAALFAKDAWQLPPNSLPLVGSDSLRRFWVSAVQWGRWDFDFATQDVVASGPLAVERGRYALRFTAGSQAPMPSVVDSGNYVVLWRQDQDRRWRIVWDAPVSVVPPAGQPRP